MSTSLAGRNVFVTGPSGRLAGGIAHAARDRGARVALATSEGGEDIEGRPCPGFSTDVVSETAADELFERAAGLIPNLDTVVVVTAVPPLGAIHELSIEGWGERATAPLRRVFWLVRRAVEGFLADAVNGRIVLVVEPIAERNGTNEVVAAALMSFARSFAREYGRRGLACNLVVLGESLRASTTEQHDLLHSVVEQVLFLASPAASFVNGEAMVVRCPSR